MKRLLLAGTCLAVCTCGGGQSASNAGAPTGPTPSPSGQTCRTYATAAADLVTNPNAVPAFTLTNTYTSVFNAATNQIVTTGTVTTSTGCSGQFNDTSTWASPADFIAEVSVIPPLQRRTRLQTSGNACGAPLATTVFTYDSQNRVTQQGITSYTAWDSFGRPTAGTLATAAGTASVSISYDNAARTSVTTVRLGSNPPALVTASYDANGNQVGISEPTTGTTAVTTIQSTATLCR
jgi:hypothetical protein